MLLPLACAITALQSSSSDSGSSVYDRRPWSDEGEWVSLETHEDGTPFVPVPGDGGLCGALHMEAENMTLSPAAPGMPPPFNVTGWGRDHYYGATFENTFAHSKALLHSKAHSVGSARGTMQIPKAAKYYVGVRYEAAYRFETEFTLKVSQGGSAKLTQLYGQRASPKLWAFGWSLKNHEIGGCGLDPTPECHWTWGATENWVWEYYPAQLAAGTATFEISITNVTSKPGLAPLADRNIDAIVLTTNLSDIKMRALNEQGSVPTDGLFTQRNKVFLKVTNHGNEDMTLTVPFCAYHSSYAPMHMFCIPYCKYSSNGKVYGSATNIEIPVPKGATTPKWVEVGSRLDTMNDMTWEFTAKKYVPPKPPPSPPGPKPHPKPHPKPPPPAPPFAPSYTVEFGVMKGGKVVPISTKEAFTTKTANLQVAVDASVSNFQRIRRPDDSLYEALAEAKNVSLAAGAAPPKLTPIFGYSFCTSPSIRNIEPSCFLETSVSPGYDKAFAEFSSLFPMSDTSMCGLPNSAQAITPYQKKTQRGYFEARAIYRDTAKLKAALGNITAAGDAADYMVVSMGDEIALSVPPGAVGEQQFQQWMKLTYPAVHVSKYNATICYDAKACNPSVHYYSNLYSAAYGLSVLAPATKAITSALKNAGVGANYSPLDYNPHGGYSQFQYWYPVNKAVTIFRKQAMTLPWSEDYTWQSPVGTQQMTTILHDMFRAGLRGVDKTPATSRVMSYIMAHAPGTTAKMWRRAMYGYLAHGVTMINLYEFRPCLASYTENYVDTGWGMYGGVRQALSELTHFEDIVQDGRVLYGDVGIWNSEVSDIWGPVTPPIVNGQHFNTWLAAKRALYIVLQHAELAVDMVVEEDIGPTLNTYRMIVLADTHVSKKGSSALAAWVAAGGVLFATAGAGAFDELNQTNTVMAKLLGVGASHGTYEPSEVQFIKQDLINASVMGRVSWGTDSSSVTTAVAARHFFEPASETSSVIARFDDTKQSAAAVYTATGKGAAFYYAFYVGLSYFLPAMPLRPADRGALDSSYTHFIPTAYDAAVLGLVKNLSASASAVSHVTCSNHLVHGKPIVSRSKKGVAIPLVNWAGQALKNLTVTINIDAVKKGMKATLATGAQVTEVPSASDGGGNDGEDAGVTFRLDLDVADALILR